MKRLPLYAIAMIGIVPLTMQSQLPAYNVPDDPAFKFLGTSPKKVDNPGTTTKFGASVADGIDVDGHVQSGLAISTPPADLLRWSPKIEAYRRGTPGFWFYNTQVSIGSVRTSGDTASTDFAFGARMIFIGPDPYTDPSYLKGSAAILDRCFAVAREVDSVTSVVQSRTGVRPFETRSPDKPTEILKPDMIGKPITLDTVEIQYLDARGRVLRQERAVVRRLRNGATLAADTVRIWPPTANVIDNTAAVECASKGKSELLKRWAREHWNDASLSLAAASGTRFLKSEFSDRKSIGYSTWAVASLPIRWTAHSNGKERRANFGQIAAQIQYDQRTLRAPSDSVTGRWIGGVRLAGGSPIANAFVESVYTLKEKGPAEEDKKTDWSAGIEYMLGQGLWISAGIGERFSTVAKTDKSIVFLNLKWGVARKPLLAAR